MTRKVVLVAEPDGGAEWDELEKVQAALEGAGFDVEFTNGYLKVTVEDCQV